MFQYFKFQIVNNGFTVLEETHFSEETVNGWRDDFKGEVFFSHGSTRSSGVMIDYLGNKKFLVNKTRKYHNGRLLIIEAKMEAEIFILLNLYNSNSETEQLQTLSNVDLLLSDFSLGDKKTLVFDRKLYLFFNQALEALG